MLSDVNPNVIKHSNVFNGYKEWPLIAPIHTYVQLSG